VAKKASTAAEAAQEGMGIPAGSNLDDVPGKFASYMKGIKDANVKTLEHQGQDISDASKAFGDWRLKHPEVDWAAGAGAIVALGPGGALAGPAQSLAYGPSAPAGQDVRDLSTKASAAAPFPGREPTSFERGPGEQPASPMLSAKPSAVSGPGGDVFEGWGTVKGIRNAQLKEVGDVEEVGRQKAREFDAQMQARGINRDVLGEQADSLRYKANEIYAAQQDFDQRKTDEQAKIQQASDAQAARGVDPGRSFKNMSTGKTLAFILGAIGGGLVAGVPGNGGRNPFIEMVNKQVEQDIAAQEKDLEQGWKGVKGMETAYENMRRNGVDMIVAKQTQQDQVYAALELDLSAKLSKAQDPVERARYDQALQAVQLERDRMTTDIQKYAGNQRAQYANAAASAADKQYNRMMAERKMRVDESRAMAQNAKDYGEADVKVGARDKAFVVTGIDPATGRQTGGYARDEAAAAKVDDAIKNSDSILKSIAEIRRLRSEPGGGAYGRGTSKVAIGTPAWVAKVNSEASNLTIGLNSGSGAGTIDKGTVGYWEAQVGDLTSIGPAGDRALDQLESRARRDKQNYLDTHVQVPGEKSFDPATGKSSTRETGGMGRAPSGQGLGELGPRTK